MKNRVLLLGGIMIAVFFFSCDKKADSSYAKYLNAAEIAKPGKVDSMEILPGYNRALIKFKVSPDRRVNKIKIDYYTSISYLINTKTIDVTETDFGKFKELLIDNLPEANLFVNIVTYSAAGDSSSVSDGVGAVYGNRYASLVANRIFSNITTTDGIKSINFAGEQSRPRDSTLFYPLQKTVLTYPTILGDTNTIEFSPHTNTIPVPDIADSGTITHYSVYKPTSNAIDVFKSSGVSVTF
ncbi:DUF4998 domain-containing protein [Niabella hirudinis]|uniref:DUF4998 domain-containing protein n=1 Tax=Niabella hirudinis TaxID=1285929 RepID=UPI003EBE2084